MAAPFLLEIRSGMGSITLNRPDRHNAKNDEASDPLGTLFAQALQLGEAARWQRDPRILQAGSEVIVAYDDDRASVVRPPH